MSICLLCDHEKLTFMGRFVTEKSNPLPWSYLQCDHCGLIFRCPEERLNLEDEKARYSLHNNDASDVKYRNFLNQLWEPLKNEIEAGAEGLDYGCGPTRAFAALANTDGYNVDSYDPLFFPKFEKNKIYDFIFCSEAAEHFYHPVQEFEKMFNSLKPDGILGVMTLFYNEKIDFHHWFYRKDPTHVVFYTPETMGWISQCHGRSWRQIGDRVALFGPPAVT